MSRLQELINELCPNGVEYKTLNELGQFYGGLTGKSKKDFVDGNSKFITYTNVYRNPALKLDIDEKVYVGENENQRSIQYGDVIFTGSSETLDECAFSSVVTEEPKEKMYLNSFCFIFRMNDLNLYNLDFLKHLFRSFEIRKKLIKTASGVTRFNVSKEKMGKITIPIPPLPVQEEIVRILDKMTDYVTELKAELKARKLQYEYYRNYLLAEGVEAMCLGNVSYTELCNICSITKGTQFNKRNMNKEGSFPVINGGVNPSGYIEQYNQDENTITISQGGASAGYVNWINTKFWAGVHCYVLKPRSNVLNRYLFHFIKANESKLQECQYGAGIPALSKSVISALKMPIPPIDIQEKIVSILDNFNTICEDISNGLPAEVEMRQKQYEYYRDKLLNFKKIETEE